ncbi:SPP1 gp7 family putative phage head morphogenesis protein [Clostridium saccharoperbutylacetonicum]|uniref:Phage putative head morphogenesis protein, SPP1 gp7 family n=1 Tax=Clostridium saccharoperbutylacetonicum N1-4(HMT) TaxID=931276 RepID=M1MJF3_9CLOT|nr:minor capsid protein [Clostridium saccharoperbutylacetonicum]AGF56453.1 phage putative head morphogenesis protein, SPP1 gp7 family [Clostridium saccharoperbutylacetonicum N1-4(HMT)]NRT62800.1 SPP1 gp7 family putative phage head morphogenesis protein [Clostridium saccharoperbutylacetonicum]NSB26154.1 SPP1 gp7 family putative phage head morphogenesis protein [Clostridium saccharoperbutylacetonicum]NSB45508.1 SPP1 gp7 family putative phage head morphogenesis protein [Clostridium saccharoperbuty
MDKNKLTKEQNFFNDKTLEFAKELYDKNEEKLKEAYKGQIKNRDGLLSKIAKILLSYNITDNILNINAADKKKLYSELSDLIVANIKSELNFETSLTKGILTGVGKEKFNANNYIYSLGADFNLTQLSDEALEKIINTKVDNKLWSDRLYDNKNEICQTLQTEVEKFLKGETNVNQIEQKIIEKYDTNAHETKRLVQDNICRVQEGANDEWQHEHGIKKVMYMATLDGKVCSRCAQYDSQTFDIDKKPVQIPQHPFCRCVYISLVSNWHPRVRLDNETKQNINWQSYQEWKKNYIDNNPERLANHKMIKNKS